MKILARQDHQKTHIAAWGAQGILGAMFTGIGAFKLFGPMPLLGEKFQWPREYGEIKTRMIGAAELAGGLGSVLPAASRIAPWLTPLAALGLDVVMISAVVHHVRRREWKQLALPLALGTLAGFVLWGRTRAKPICSR